MFFFVLLGVKGEGRGRGGVVGGKVRVKKGSIGCI